MEIFVKKINPQAELPTFAHLYDACADVRAVADEDIEPGQTVLLGTGLAFAIPDGFEIVVRPRSGLSIRHHLTLVNSPGTIDATYRGEVMVALRNNGSETYHIQAGDRIAQLGVRQVPDVTFVEVSSLPETERGTGGFGSTGR